MLDFPRWKVWSISLVILIGILFAIPSMLPAHIEARYPKWLPSATINLGLDTLLPEGYVPTLQQRIEVYRDVSRAADLEQVRQVGRGLRDRFGPPPQPARDMLLEAEIRIMADQAGVDSIQVRDARLHFSLRDAESFRAYFASAVIRPRLVGEQEAVVEAPRGDARAAALFVRDMFVKA